MPGRLHRFLADDHDRLEEFLKQLAGQEDIIADHPAYLEFRQGLLRHIAMEEKVLIPFAKERRGSEPLPIAAKIRSDHGALAALLAPTPTAQIVATIRTILEAHNTIEEDPGGLYEKCEELAGAELGFLLDRLRAVPEVRLAPHSDSPRALESMREAVERAGYSLSS